MESFVAVIHILIAFVLIILVLIQDTKSGSVGVFGGGGGSNSVLGATGATTLAQKLTRWAAAIFAITCISLSVFSVRSRSSILDGMPVAPAAATAPTGIPVTTPGGDTMPVSPGTQPIDTTGAPVAPAAAPTGN